MSSIYAASVIEKIALMILTLAVIIIAVTYLIKDKKALEANVSRASGIAGDQRYLIWNEWTFSIDSENISIFKQRVDQARASGFNAVRFAIYWPKLETFPGIFLWSKFDSRIHYLVRKGFKVAINFQAMVVKDKNIVPNSELMYDSNGNLFIGNPINGQAHAMISFASDTALQKTASIFSKIVSRYNSRYPSGSVLFYQTTFSPYGETEYWPSSLLDYSSAAKRQFQSWLQQKYGTIDQMNNTLGTTFFSFTVVLPPTHQNGNFGLAWYAFRSDMLKRAIDRMADTTHAINPNLKFGIQFGSVWDTFSPVRGTVLFDHLAEKADWVTIDDAPSYPHTFSADYLRGTLSDKHLANEIDSPNAEGASDPVYIQQGQQSYDRGLIAVTVANWSYTDLINHKTVIDSLVRYLEDGIPAITASSSMNISAVGLIWNGPNGYVSQHATMSEYGSEIIDVMLVNDTGY